MTKPVCVTIINVLWSRPHAVFVSVRIIYILQRYALSNKKLQIIYIFFKNFNTLFEKRIATIFYCIYSEFLTRNALVFSMKIYRFRGYWIFDVYLWLYYVYRRISVVFFILLCIKMCTLWIKNKTVDLLHETK